MKKILYILAAGAMLLASCSKENSSPNVDDTAVRFSTEITTRASGTTWATNDAIGIFMKTAGGDISTSEILNASNVKYSTDGTNFTTTTPIYYPILGAVDFVAYYPWRTKPATDPYIYKVDVGVQTTPAAIDLLYSNNAANKSKNTTAVPLIFDHKLSRMVLNITKGDGMGNADLSGMEVRIAGMPTKANFSLADGTLSNESVVAAITPRTVTAGTTYYDAIVIPQAANSYAGRKMVFTVGTDVYEYLIPDADDFLSGKSYTYTVTVKKTGIEVSKGQITDWTGTENSEGIGAIEQLPIPMVLIPAGTFQMGSPDDEPKRQTNETQHKVTLTKDFYMGKYTITNAQYAAFLNGYNAQNPTEQITNTENKGKYNINVTHDGTWFSLINSTEIEYNGTTTLWQSKAGLGNHPFINVSHHGALAFCEFYGYRLPTEAEWEYACRGDYEGKATETATLPFGIGTGKKLVLGMANYYILYSYDLDGNSPGEYNVGNDAGYLNKTSAVGQYTANNYGLYDMHGNVWEWCSDKCDWLIADYDAGTATDPTGSSMGDNRMLRGGYWYSYAQNCRSANRSNYFPAYRDDYIGFRVVFVP